MASAIKEYFQVLTGNVSVELPMLADLSSRATDLAALGDQLKSILRDGAGNGALQTILSGEAAPIDQINEQLPASLIDGLLEFDLAKTDGSVLRPLFQAKELGGNIFFSDRLLSMRLVRRTEAKDLYVDPFWEGPAIASILPKRKIVNALDMGCGCGVLALTMARYAERVFAVDLNPRALMITQLNAALNNIDNVEIRESNLFAALDQLQFDQIAFNAPVALENRARNLQESGEEILRLFFQQIHGHLTDNGDAIVNSCVKDWENNKFLDRLRSWLGDQAHQYQPMYLEQWVLDDGLRFEARKAQSRLLDPKDYGALKAIRKGLICLRKTSGMHALDVPTSYHDWTEALGVNTSGAITEWAFNTRPGAIGVDELDNVDLLQRLAPDERAVAKRALCDIIERGRRIEWP